MDPNLHLWALHNVHRPYQDHEVHYLGWTTSLTFIRGISLNLIQIQHHIWKISVYYYVRCWLLAKANLINFTRMQDITITALYTQCRQFISKFIQLLRIKTRWIVFNNPCFISLPNFIQTDWVIVSSRGFGPNVEIYLVQSCIISRYKLISKISKAIDLMLKYI